MTNKIEVLGEEGAIRIIVTCLYHRNAARLFEGAEAAASKFLGQAQAKSVGANTGRKISQIAELLGGDDDVHDISSATAKIAESISFLSYRMNKNYRWLFDLMGEQPLPDSLPHEVDTRYRELYEVLLLDLQET